FVQCKQCSYIFECKSCSVSLTLHENNMLICHYCDYKQEKPTTCICNASQRDLLNKGLGTQQVVSVVQKLLPQARIARADLDTTIHKKKWQKTLQDFYAGHYDILVGTQTIAKGYDFTNIGLVGILWADLNIHFPLYNAAEVALQQ